MCDFYYDCKGCGGRGVVGGVYRSVVTCTDCGGYGFKPQIEVEENPTEEPSLFLKFGITPEFKVKRKTSKIKISKYQKKWLEACRQKRKLHRV